jgi:hypothetical protein
MYSNRASLLSHGRSVYEDVSQSWKPLASEPLDFFVFDISELIYHRSMPGEYEHSG